jgi:hypothetical protein
LKTLRRFQQFHFSNMCCKPRRSLLFMALPYVKKR